MDPSYLETSESTGGQLFLFQRDDVAQTAVVMSATGTHPQTVARFVGHLSGEREFEFPIDSTVESLFVLASLQCRNSIAVFGPGGQERTSANSASRVDSKAGQILKVDTPEFGKWKIRLAGSGLFVVSVLAKSAIQLAAVRFYEEESAARLSQPRFAMRQRLEASVAGEVSDVRFHLIDPAGNMLPGVEAVDTTAPGAYRMAVTPRVERFRIVMSGVDALGRTVQRTGPVLFRAELPK